MKTVLVIALALSAFAAEACPDIKGSYRCSINGGTSSVEMQSRTVKTPQNSYRYWILDSEIEAAALPVRRTSEGMGFILVATASCQGNSIKYKLEQLNADTNSNIGELNMTVEKMDDDTLKIEISNTGDENQSITCNKVN